MEKKTTVYVKLDADKEVRIELVHVTGSLPAPNEKNRERGLSVRELDHVARRLRSLDYTLGSTI